MELIAENTITALKDLLTVPDEDSDSDDDFKPKGGSAALGPGDVGSKKKSSNSDSSRQLTTVKQESKDIWTTDEVSAGAEFDDVDDPREQPHYEVVYRQAVSSEDMFLQLGNKTPMTSSCEELVVKVVLPNTTLAEVELDVKDTFFDCRTPKYKLGLFLPHPVDSKNAKAEFNSETQTLSVLLRLNRMLDFINF